MEVFNFALRGWSTRQERYAYERIARAYRPDTVVLAICLNDVEDLQNNLSRPPRLVTALFRRSALVRRVLDPEAREITSIEELFETPESPRVGRGYARLFEEVRLLQAAVEDDGARLVLMLFPDADQVGPRPHQPVPQERMRAFARMEGLLLADPLPALRAIGPAPRSWTACTSRPRGAPRSPTRRSTPGPCLPARGPPPPSPRPLRPRPRPPLPGGWPPCSPIPNTPCGGRPRGRSAAAVGPPRPSLGS